MPIKDSIASAGRNLNTLLITLKTDTQQTPTLEIEPYCYRVQNGVELLFCYDRSQGTTRNIELSNIASAQETAQAFTPRWPVEVMVTTVRPPAASTAQEAPNTAKNSPLANSDSRLLHKPKAVIRASNLLWFSLGVGLLQMLFPSPLKSDLPASFTAATVIASYALVIWLIINMGAGKHWARVTYLVFFLLGALPNLMVTTVLFATSTLLGMLSVAQLAIQAYALYLLFTQPGSHWFKK